MVYTDRLLKKRAMYSMNTVRKNKLIRLREKKSYYWAVPLVLGALGAIYGGIRGWRYGDTEATKKYGPYDGHNGWQRTGEIAKHVLGQGTIGGLSGAALGTPLGLKAAVPYWGGTALTALPVGGGLAINDWSNLSTAQQDAARNRGTSEVSAQAALQQQIQQEQAQEAKRVNRPALPTNVRGVGGGNPLMTPSRMAPAPPGSYGSGLAAPRPATPTPPPGGPAYPAPTATPAPLPAGT